MSLPGQVCFLDSKLMVRIYWKFFFYYYYYFFVVRITRKYFFSDTSAWLQSFSLGMPVWHQHLLATWVPHANIRFLISSKLLLSNTLKKADTPKLFFFFLYIYMMLAKKFCMHNQFLSTILTCSLAAKPCMGFNILYIHLPPSWSIFLYQHKG